jgi:hypothetical protein
MEKRLTFTNKKEIDLVYNFLKRGYCKNLLCDEHGVVSIDVPEIGEKNFRRLLSLHQDLFLDEETVNSLL